MLLRERLCRMLLIPLLLPLKFCTRLASRPNPRKSRLPDSYHICQVFGCSGRRHKQTGVRL